MKPLMLTPAVLALALALAPSLASAQLNPPLTSSQASHQATARSGGQAAPTLGTAPQANPAAGPHAAAEAVGRVWDQPETSAGLRPESAHTPHVALVQTDDAHYPDPRFSTPSHPWLIQTTVGVSTEALMQAQVNGTHAGPALPTLGAAAGLSYQRYLKSFTLPLPATFQQTVETSK